MKRIQIVERDFKTVGRIQNDFHGTQGLAVAAERKIYIDSACAPRTKWGKRVIIEHEIAHLNVADAGLEEKLTPSQSEMLADWIGYCRVPGQDLHINERYMKQWLLNGLNWRRVDERVVILVRIIKLLEILPDRPAEETATMLCAAMR